MKSTTSAIIIAAAFALLVPNYQGLGAAESFRAAPVSASRPAPAPVIESTMGERSPAPDLDWVLVLGFLGALMARRLRAD